MNLNYQVDHIILDHSVSDIQDYFEYISKNHNENIDNLSIKIYLNKIENSIKLKIKTGYYLEPLTSETMKIKIKMVKMYPI